MTPSPRRKARLGVLAGGLALGCGAFAGTALPAHATVFVTCSSTSTLSTSVFGFGCSAVVNTPQPGIISGPAHRYSCGTVEKSPLIGDITGYECIEMV